MSDGLEVGQLRGAFVGPVDLCVPAGSCAAILGPSGSGKSLLLRMIADLVPNEGKVRLGGLLRADLPAPAWRRQVVYAGGTGWWDERVAAHFPPETLAQSKALIGRVGLGANYLDRLVATLSTGEAQRLALVRALVRAPKLLLLDEPTSALDTESTLRVEESLREALGQGLTLLLVTHDPGQASRIADRRYAMAVGRLAPV